LALAKIKTTQAEACATGNGRALAGFLERVRFFLNSPLAEVAELADAPS
jgi:hypothetical protein